MSSELDSRDRILDAAKEAFLENGTAGARMQEIADAAGVNKALIHYYFQNKDTLAAAVFQRELRGLIQPVMQTLTSDLSLDEKVRRAIALYMERLSAVPQMPGYVLAELHFHPERREDLFEFLTDVTPATWGQRVFTSLGRQIDAEVDAGRMRPISPQQFLVNLISLCVFPFAARPLLQLVTGGAGPFDAFIQERGASLPEFFLGALRP